MTKMASIKTIDQKSKPAKKLNELPVECKRICYKYYNNHLLFYNTFTPSFTSYFNNADAKYASFNLKG